MSFIPGEQSDIAAVASLNGSGITVSTSGDVDYITTNLVAGAGVAITPNLTNTSITISSTGSGGGISSVSSGVGSGINATTVGEATTLTSALVAGNGISLTPAGVGTNLTISNTNTLSSANGSGITLIPNGTNTAIATNLVAGAGMTITPNGLNSSQTISNTGVVGITSGTGIGVNQSTGTVQVSNNGVVSLSAGTGIGVNQSTGTVQVSNNGVVSLSAGSGIILSANTGAITVSATGSSAPVGQNITEIHQWTPSGINVNGDGTYNIAISVPLVSPNGWSSTFPNVLVQFSVSLTQTLTTVSSVSPVVETLTFQSGTVVSPSLNDPILPYQISNNVGITTNGQTYTNTYTGSFIIGGANVVVPGYVYSMFINATNNIGDGISFTNYVVNTGWVSITPTA